VSGQVRLGHAVSGRFMTGVGGPVGPDSVGTRAGSKKVGSGQARAGQAGLG
jgi:hypothetical protein